MKIHVFDVDKLSRHVLDRTWPNLAAKSAENDPKMAPQNDPKSTKNGCQKMIKIWIDFKRAIVRYCALQGVARRTALGSWGENEGGDKCPRLNKNECSATSSAIVAFDIGPKDKTTKKRPNIFDNLVSSACYLTI